MGKIGFAAAVPSSFVLALALATAPRAQTSAVPPTRVAAATQVTSVTVTGRENNEGYAASPRYDTQIAPIGPLGSQPILDAPQTVTVVPEDLIVNQQTRNVNDMLRFLPSVEIRDQQGFEVSRPQSRGFQSSIVQNTRLDGLIVIGTTAIPAENLAGTEVLNGPSGALFGPETPAGVFDYLLKRPTDRPLLRFQEGFQSDSTFTEQLDAGGRIGPVGARLNVVHGEGDSYVNGSHVNRTLASIALDFHLDPKAVVEADYSHCETEATGLPGSIAP